VVVVSGAEVVAVVRVVVVTSLVIVVGLGVLDVVFVVVISVVIDVVSVGIGVGVDVVNDPLTIDGWVSVPYLIIR